MPTAERLQRQKQLEEQRAREQQEKRRIEAASQRLKSASAHHDEQLAKLVEECAAHMEHLPNAVRSRLANVRASKAHLETARADWAVIEREYE